MQLPEDFSAFSFELPNSPQQTLKPALHDYDVKETKF